ncbi:MAG TPA: NUDIX domain-containing protein [Streptosporangiaceae bacterium]|nr:NUDIX domain-containing protein [Streptosporangiaceae bacterium]
MGDAGDREMSEARVEAWAPDDVFESILRYSVIPTFDLILEGVEGILLVRRRIAPYRDLWALPGLRILKGEAIEACLERIAHDEVGLQISPAQGMFINQAIAKFKTHHERQDLSTCYAFELEIDQVTLNDEHLSSSIFIRDKSTMPNAIGGLYREHLYRYFDIKNSK